VAVLAFCACNGDHDSDSAQFVAADADADVDADADTDPDAIVGTVSYDWTVNGETLCDATIAFTGEAYAGPCPECDFVFKVTGEPVRDDGNGACPFMGKIALYNNVIPFADWTAIGFADRLSSYGETYDDVFVVAYYWTYAGKYAGPYYAHFGASYGDASLTGDLLEWSYSGSFEYYLYPYYYNGCDWDLKSEATGPFPSGNTIYASLPCQPAYVDVFTFQGSDGGTARVTVDTTGDPGFDPRLWIYGPESCVEQFADDNFPCTFGDDDCPSLSVSTESAGYLLVVEQNRGCSGGASKSSDYRLDLDADWDPGLTQIRDDLDNEGDALIQITGTATLK
jgi:hypothetical protein